MSHEMVAPINPVAVVLRGGKRFANFLRERLGDALIRIEDEDPLLGRLWNRPVLEVATRAILALDDPAAQLARDLECTVCRPGVRNENFVGYLPCACDARRDVI